MQKPVVSVDRAVAHHFESLDLDYGNIAGFYDSLPYGGKPELEDCRIHFSGLALQNYRTYPQSAYLENPVDIKAMDPDAPSANVVIFTGSFLVNHSLDELDATVRGQLRNYAQRADFERFLQGEEGDIRRRLAVADKLPKIGDLWGQTVWLGLVYGMASNAFGEPATWKADLAAGAIARAAHLGATRGDRQDKAKKVQKELANHLENLRNGGDRSQIGDTALPLVSVVPREDAPRPIKRPFARRERRRIVSDYRHYHRSLKPAPGNAER